MKTSTTNEGGKEIDLTVPPFSSKKLYDYPIERRPISDFPPGGPPHETNWPALVFWAFVFGIIIGLLAK